jgi:hypothetical protein
MERVVITGIGLVTPNGMEPPNPGGRLSRAARHAPITLFDASAYNLRSQAR